MNTVCSIIASTLIGAVIPVFAAADGPEPLIGVGVIRQQAATVVFPAYPTTSFGAGHEGRAVIEVRVSADGKVKDAHTVEAPDRDIGNAVEAAIKQWTFRPLRNPDNNQPLGFRSNLIFYFKRIDGKPVVIDAAAEAIAAHKRHPAITPPKGK